MKNVLILTIFLSIYIPNCFSQREQYINRDTLLNLFKTKEPFTVLAKTNGKMFNYKELYYDEELKPYFMKWLDTNLFAEYLRSKDSVDFQVHMNSKVERVLKAKGVPEDSIMEDSILYNVIKDSVFQDLLRESVERNSKYYKYPMAAIHHHSYLAYPESYEIMNHFFLTDTSEVMCTYMLRLRAPEAQQYYDRKIKEFIESNGRNGLSLSDLYWNLTLSIRTPYTIEKTFELLSADIQITTISEDPSYPLNCKLLYELSRWMDFYGIERDYQLPKLDKKNACKKILELTPLIKKRAEKLSKIYEEKDLYWMKNMPYYKE